VDAYFRLIADGVSAPSWTRGGCAQARGSMYLSRPRSVWSAAWTGRCGCAR